MPSYGSRSADSTGDRSPPTSEPRALQHLAMTGHRLARDPRPHREPPSPANPSRRTEPAPNDSNGAMRSTTIRSPRRTPPDHRRAQPAPNAPRRHPRPPRTPAPSSRSNTTPKKPAADPRREDPATGSRVGSSLVRVHHPVPEWIESPANTSAAVDGQCCGRLRLPRRGRDGEDAWSPARVADRLSAGERPGDDEARQAQAGDGARRELPPRIASAGARRHGRCQAGRLGTAATSRRRPSSGPARIPVSRPSSG